MLLTAFTILQEIPNIPETGDVTQVLAWVLGVAVMAIGALWRMQAKAHESTMEDLRSRLTKEQQDNAAFVQKLMEINTTTLDAMRDLGIHVDGTNKAIESQNVRIQLILDKLADIAALATVNKPQ